MQTGKQTDDLECVKLLSFVILELIWQPTFTGVQYKLNLCFGCAL